MMLLEHQAGQDKQRVQVGDAWEDQDGRVFTIDTGAPLFSDSVTQWFSNFIAQLGSVHISTSTMRAKKTKAKKIISSLS